jgi:hypothetical protein
MLVIAHSYTKDLAWIEIDFPFLKTKFRKEYSMTEINIMQQPLVQRHPRTREDETYDVLSGERRSAVRNRDLQREE